MSGIRTIRYFMTLKAIPKVGLISMTTVGVTTTVKCREPSYALPLFF